MDARDVKLEVAGRDSSSVCGAPQGPRPPMQKSLPPCETPRYPSECAGNGAEGPRLHAFFAMSKTRSPLVSPPIGLKPYAVRILSPMTAVQCPSSGVGSAARGTQFEAL